MDGFKNTTKTQYSMGGYAKGGSKGAAKVGKVMGEFKAGTLHSGSKKGPEVTNPKQAVAIALSEARKAVMKKDVGGTVKMTDAEKRMNAIQKNETGSAVRTQAPKPATSKPATTSGNKPMTDAEKHMNDIQKNETGEYKKGGSAQRKPSAKTADALRAQKYKAAMASRPNREPIIPVKDPAKVQMAAGAIKSAIEKAISTRAAQQPAPQAAPPMEAAAPPMMGAPAMKKGGKFMKKSGKVAVSSVDWAPGMPRENIVEQRQFTVTSGPGQGKREAMSAGPKIIGDTLYPSGSYKLTPEDMKDLNKDTGIDPYQKDRIARIKSGASTSPDAYKKGGKVSKRQDGGMATSIRPTKDYNASDKDFVSARAEQLKGMVGKAEGGKADLKQDKAMIKAAIHKHERHDHPGKPLTKLLKGGMPC